MFCLLVDWLAAGMKAMYSNMGIQKSPEEKDTWPPTIVKSYISLALMYQKNLQASEITAETTYIILCTKGDISDTLQTAHCKQINLKTFFFPHQVMRLTKFSLKAILE